MAPVPKSWIVRTLSQKPASRSRLIHKIKDGSGSPSPGLCGRWTPLRQRFAQRGSRRFPSCGPRRECVWGDEHGYPLLLNVARLTHLPGKCKNKVESRTPPSPGFRPPSPVGRERGFIYGTIYPGWRSLCVLILGYYLSALQAFNLCEFVKFVSSRGLPGSAQRTPINREQVSYNFSKPPRAEPWDAGWRFSTALGPDRSVAGGLAPSFAACRR